MNNLVVLSNQLIGELNVLLFGIGLRGALQVLPRLPLVLAFQVKHSWLWSVVVAGCSLLVQTIQLQQFVIGRAFGQV